MLFCQRGKTANRFKNKFFTSKIARLILETVSFMFDTLAFSREYNSLHLRPLLLLQFMEHLEKLVYNATEGCAVSLPMTNKVSNGISREAIVQWHRELCCNLSH